ncbi:MAG TPA: LCP family protein [Nocardioides sp.]|nr:LCP family protein [Nocardioides sp.]
MADGPGRQGEPEFNWLYGKNRGVDDEATQAIQQQARPDQTRQIPVQQQPPPYQPPRQPTRPTPPPAAPPPGAPPERSRGGSRFRRPKFYLRLVLVLLALWLVYLIAVPLFAWQKVDKVEFAPDGDRPGDQPGTTYLMVGSDSRGDLSEEERKELGTGNAAGQRTDTIMILHTGDGPNLLMSIPRDSRVAIPGHGDDEKINAAFAYGGPKLLTETIENETGIRIDHYVEIGFGGFVDLVDAVGGIEVCPKQAIKDPLANLNIKKGCQEVDGVEALGYSRSRKTYAQGDLQRAQAQREVVSAIGREVASPWTVINPFRYWSVNMAATQAVAVGEGMGPIRAVMWASAMTNVDGEDGLTCGVPIADLSVQWDEEKSEQMFQAIIEDDTDSISKKLCTKTGLPRP